MVMIMAKYINAVTAAKTISFEMGIPLSDLVDCFACMPTADVEPVKHGRWIYGEYNIPHCSECGSEVMPNNISLFCPNCGAKMDGGGE